MASVPRSLAQQKAFAASGETVTTAEWVRQKREQLRRVGAADVRNLVPTLKDFALAVSTRRQELAVVAEIARATPEEGKLRQSLDVAQMSGQIDLASAAALAVATDELVCAAQPSDLPLAARATSSPVVARDLILVPEQLYSLRLMGADAILLTAGALAAQQIRSFIEILASMHMSAPVEVASEEELSASVAAGAKLFVIPAFGQGGLSLSLADALLPRMPRTAVVMVRGPFAQSADLAPLRGRADGIWIAGPWMSAADPASFLEQLVRAAETG